MSESSTKDRPAGRRAWIISIGTELTLGQGVDTNAAWLAQQLGTHGIWCERHVTLPDDLPAIRDTLYQAARARRVVILTGGLGPTADDLTRAALAEAAGVELETDPASLAQIRAFFARRGHEMSQCNAVQALIPKTGRAIENTCGTAPGIYIELNGTPCFALPGVPFEMETMFARDVAPHLRAVSAGQVLRHRRLRCFGLGESDIGALLQDLMTPGQNPSVSTTAELGVITVRINALGGSEAEAEEMLERSETAVRTRLEKFVFGRDSDTLASVVGEKLLAGGKTLSTAESCTGGLIAKMLTDTPGSSGYFVGGAVTYADDAKEQLLGVPPGVLAAHGAVSEPVAQAMTRGAQRVFGSTYAIAVTGVAGPSGGTAAKPVGLVFFALATPSDESTLEVRFGSDAPREAIRVRAAHTALDMLRLRLA